VQPPLGEKQTLATSTLNAKAEMVMVILRTKIIIAGIFFMNFPQIKSENYKPV
jgi:hypothetical protein